MPRWPSAMPLSARLQAAQAQVDLAQYRTGLHPPALAPIGWPDRHLQSVEVGEFVGAEPNVGSAQLRLAGSNPIRMRFSINERELPALQSRGGKAARRGYQPKKHEEDYWHQADPRRWSASTIISAGYTVAGDAAIDSGNRHALPLRRNSPIPDNIIMLSGQFARVRGVIDSSARERCWCRSACGQRAAGAFSAFSWLDADKAWSRCTQVELGPKVD